MPAPDGASLLLFADRSGARMAVALDDVERLEAFPRGSVDRSGHEDVVRYGERILRLTPVDELLADRRRGVRYTDEQLVRERVRIPDGANAFTIATQPLEAALAALPTIERVSVTVRLPGTLAVDVTERDPILVWRVGDRRFLADLDGTLFAEVGLRPTPDADRLPVVDDLREASVGFVVGTKLDAVDLDAARRLGALEPAQVGSSGATLRISVSDGSGFVLRGASGWAAIFGFYTPSLRTPEIIAGQVRALRSLLVEQGERNVARIVLASETDGTFTTPVPSPGSSPGPSTGASSAP
jgi:hypothetical protein